MTKQSIAPALTNAQVIANEANRVIATLKLPTPADREMVEVALESLKAVADIVAPAVGNTIGIRIIAIRNNIGVNSIKAA
ncbi:hypothetical protein [Shewanella baltica]|uniref:Uncharacterized protein n=1 Tax=Shewanella baltica (strain OS155 / ATCC BAA-1091) TaxID=325240 RepID=A3D227_SHEB5|nr:hypothetical protein [Shewanella baltica]ABN60790.1 conserved hypothetical protein [Shewanella baltica OS155]AEH13137.1 hypothetical protein Sbal117_1375 [Shewanella baltica OS117]